MLDPKVDGGIRHFLAERERLCSQLGHAVARTRNTGPLTREAAALAKRIALVEDACDLLEDARREWVVSDLFWCGGYSDMSLRLSADSHSEKRREYVVTRGAEGEPYTLTYGEPWNARKAEVGDWEQPEVLGVFEQLAEAQALAQQHNDTRYKRLPLHDD